MIEIDVVPAFDLLGQAPHSRIWQDCSVRTIVTEVLDASLAEYGRTHAWGDVSRGQQSRDYCVQFRESDRDFVRRLLAEEGITAFFVHDPELGHEVLTFCDDNSQCDAFANIGGEPSLPRIEANGEQADVESARRIGWERRMTVTGGRRFDFDWRNPEYPQSSARLDSDARARSRWTHEHGGRRYTGDDLALRLADRLEAERAGDGVVTLETNASTLRPGLRFEVDDEVDDALPTDLIAFEVRHRGTGPSEGEQAGLGWSYANTVRAVAADVPLRPRRAPPKPRVEGPQTATVVGEGEIEVDEHARVRVQFHWESPPTYAADASCWIRCAQSWAADGWGAQFIPRVGMEVVVEFLEGDPDRPLITGCVYNGRHPPPFALPDCSTQSGWRTRSLPGGEGSNELRFDDAAGAEEIYVHGQRDWNIEIEHDKAETIGNDQALHVVHDRSTQIDNEKRETIGADKTIDVGANHTETIGADMSLTVGANQSIDVGADQESTIGANRKQTVALTDEEMVGISKNVLVGASMSLTVGAAYAEQVAGVKSVTVGLSSSEQITGAKTVMAKSVATAAGKLLDLSAGTDANLKATKNIGLSAGVDVKIDGTKATITALDELKLTAGAASIVLKSSGEVTITGLKITANAAAELSLKGATVKNN